MNKKTICQQFTLTQAQNLLPMGRELKFLNPSHKTPLKVTAIHARGTQDRMRSSFLLVNINIFVLLIQH